jgi:hypothetical protein
MTGAAPKQNVERAQLALPGDRSQNASAAKSHGGTLAIVLGTPEKIKGQRVLQSARMGLTMVE